MRLLIVLLSLVLVGPLHAAVQSPLKDHPSPYLAMHAGDPVRWSLWSEEVLERARRENKLIFISSGYYACHWCHVMQKESYRDPRIARLLNTYFIPVKIDREVLPALDGYLIDFVERTQGMGGWPLNVFLTPQGYPLVGMLYLPPDRFGDVLERLRLRWQQKAESMALMARLAFDSRQGDVLQPEPGLAPGLGPRLREGLVARALELADGMAGGFGDQSKFPMEPQLAALLEAYATRKDEALGAFLRLTLGQMAGQGLRDQLGGGFFRYTVDPAWQQPHFEKMLYNNAQLAVLYLRAAEVLGDPDLLQVGRDTLDFLIREMGDPQGGFIASLSAVDSEGAEGGYYLWSRSELEGLLTPGELRVVDTVWGLGAEPLLEQGALPVRAMTTTAAAARLGLRAEDLSAQLEGARAKLLAARQKRTVPRDGKRLAAWNGLALSALAAGARLQDGGAYRGAGQRLRDYLVRGLWDGKRLLRGRDRGGAVLAEGTLEDYAFLAAGLYAWGEASGDRNDFALARDIARAAWQRFRGPGGWQLGASLIPMGDGRPLVADNSLPSPAAVLARVSLGIARRFGDGGLERQALAALNGDPSGLGDDPFAYASYVTAIDAYQRGSP